jgi:hypothetical protein
MYGGSIPPSDYVHAVAKASASYAGKMLVPRGKFVRVPTSAVESFNFDRTMWRWLSTSSEVEE